MATYKVLQDVEAEDKLLGPLTLRQFIYAGVTAICLYLSYFTITHHAGFMAVIFVPVALVSAFFAFPWGRDQPTELWALAKIRFLIKPRRRIWDQSGISELVTITVPKVTQVNYTNGLSSDEVESRLRALADTIDSRGWAVKNSNLNLYAQAPLTMAEPSSDRLVGPSALPQAVETIDVQPSDDILDEKNNADAQRVETMIAAASTAHRQKIVDSLRQPQNVPPPQPPPQAQNTAPRPNNYWFLNQPAQPTNIPSDMVTFNTQVVTPGMPVDATPNMPAMPPAPDEANLVAELDAHKQQLPTTAYYSHLHTIQPLSAQHQVNTPAPMGQGQASTTPAPQAPQAAVPVQNPGPSLPVPPVTPTNQAAILQLANNDDLNVATIAREAERSASQDEVIIKLH
jgi:hypothetical protein